MSLTRKTNNLRTPEYYRQIVSRSLKIPSILHINYPAFYMRRQINKEHSIWTVAGLTTFFTEQLIDKVASTLKVLGFQSTQLKFLMKPKVSSTKIPRQCTHNKRNLLIIIQKNYIKVKSIKIKSHLSYKFLFYFSIFSVNI